MAKQLAFYVDSDKCLWLHDLRHGLQKPVSPGKGRCMAQGLPSIGGNLSAPGTGLLLAGVQPLRKSYLLECLSRQSLFSNATRTALLFTSRKSVSAAETAYAHCPYGVPQYNPTLKKAEKCSFCWQRIDARPVPGLCPVLPGGRKSRWWTWTNSIRRGLVQYAPGFPKFPALNPSVRFRLPKQPLVVRREDI